MNVSAETFSSILGESPAELIGIIARQAQQENIAIYLVGGVVRDLLAGRKNLDIDFVLEGDAIAFARHLARRFGGSLRRHEAFGTAKWILDSGAADKMALPLDQLPHHIDLAAARSERYEQPAALPTVQPSDIKRDLQRRDFTINTLAIQLSPLDEMGRILDFYGGLADLNRGCIRALHERSFIDDPTRMFRALRFARRLNFTVAPRTMQWMNDALPLLERTTGARLQNEIRLILYEPRPEDIILELQTLGILKNTDKAWRVSPQLPIWFERCREQTIPWQNATRDLPHLYWHVMMTGINPYYVRVICKDLELPSSLAQSIAAGASLIADAAELQDPSLRPSEITQFLENKPSAALQAAWLVMDAPTARQRIADFMNLWRKQRPTINGNDLTKMGLRPGPHYRMILEWLRFAWIDGKIQSEAEERALLNQLLEQAKSAPSEDIE